MLRFVVAPDSYKGSLRSLQAGTIMARAIKEQFPDADIAMLPMADGGEGTMEALVSAASGTIVKRPASGPLGEAADTAYGIIHHDTAVLETAMVCGLTMVPEAKRNPRHTTTRGLGELMRDALDRGCRKFIIGLGGSATNDGGMGLLRALGVKFLDESGRELAGFGKDTAKVHHVDFSGLDPRLRECELIAASDVTNPLCGPEGASLIFGPQKGASAQEAAQMDKDLAHYAEAVERSLGKTLKHMGGTGAAGGLGFALLAIGARIVSGASIVEETTGLREHIARADWVITGEGRSDGQSLYGKLPVHVAKIAKEYGVPAILISGSLGEGAERLYEHFAGCFSIINKPSSLQECMGRAEELLYACASNVMRLLRHARSSNEKAVI